MRKLAQRLIFVTLTLLLACGYAFGQAIEWNHDPDSPIGPNFWGSLTFPFATCGSQFDPVLQAEQAAIVEVGEKQSPVNIVTSETVRAALPALVFQYRPSPFVVENTGHVVEVPYVQDPPVVPPSILRVGQDTYQLLQFHLHAPSEHTINGASSAAELHLVHRNALLDIAVVGVMIQVGKPVNTVIDKILNNAPLDEGKVDLGGVINGRDVLPRFVSYYNYSGSLTTPHCSEGVRWFVLKEPVFVSQAAIDRFHQIISLFPAYEGYPNNNRPVRPLNGRAIFDRVGR